MRDLLNRKKMVVPNWEQNTLRLQDMFEFDHIIYFNSPSFRQYLIKNLDVLAKRKAAVGVENKRLARLTAYELIPTVQLPESMTRVKGFHEEMFLNRLKLGIDVIYRAVQNFVLDFLEQEYGLKKIGQGFEKVPTRRRSRSGSLPPLELSRARKYYEDASIEGV